MTKYIVAKYNKRSKDLNDILSYCCFENKQMAEAYLSGYLAELPDMADLENYDYRVEEIKVVSDWEDDQLEYARKYR